MTINDSTRGAMKSFRQPRPRRPVRWWELMLPAGIWIAAAKMVLASARTLRRSGVRLPYAVFSLVRLSSILWRVGFRVWRHLGGKWR